ncbi:hypothetical protein BN873_980054 [Candidatus Competibacter denitrificans Run_A_D11]|uniref:Uncharacterized protein n=1 Tax=Candidatus Competibacter denitrificans Run_A_D11 TaxID=1400863 RepID=W6MEE1_9GAMM|nr:hypothetical protein BN873_980054 [Candidatus Competibacter denitrificans Run_A_D11]
MLELYSRALFSEISGKQNRRLTASSSLYSKAANEVAGSKYPKLGQLPYGHLSFTKNKISFMDLIERLPENWFCLVDQS